MAYQDVSYIKLNAEMDEELAQACANLIAYGVVEKNFLPGEKMTRAETAVLLAAALDGAA